MRQEAFDNPADPKGPAAEPTLKPEQGGFKAFVISPSATARDLKPMVEIYDEKFK